MSPGFVIAWYRVRMFTMRVEITTVTRNQAPKCSSDPFFFCWVSGHLHWYERV